MYFQQSKLSKAEWEHCEIPVSQEEKKILHLIRDGYYDVNIKYNDNQTIAQYMKIDHTPEIEVFLYTKYFKPLIDEMTTGCQSEYLTPAMDEFLKTNFTKMRNPKKTDTIRLSNLDSNIEKQRTNIFEFIILGFCKNIFLAATDNNSSLSKKRTSNTKKRTTSSVFSRPHLISLYIYNLIYLKKIQLSGTLVVNQWVMRFVSHTIDSFLENKERMDALIGEVFRNSPDFIEKNQVVLKFENRMLYDHQKHLFTLFNRNADGGTESSSPARLIFYTAPTGTGKTLSPLGLSNQYRIIYICASRHIGLAFAKNAISIEKKVAFAFGCESAGDIRLHYFSAKDYEVNRKTGGIFKVDNSNGERVEIMICDLASYLIAMYYMLSFNDEKKCIMYWDEPTISLDQAGDHPLHPVIKEIWAKNTISNIVLSCATLPTENELISVIEDFNMKFERAEVHTISSYECRKTISLIGKDKKTVLPHLFFENHSDVVDCVRNCRNNKTILRYFDLKEVVAFIELAISVGAVDELLKISNYFRRVEELTMNGIKLYYLTVLSEILADRWGEIHQLAKNAHRPYWVEDDGGNLKKIKSFDRGGVGGGSGGTTITSNITRLASLQVPPVAPVSTIPTLATSTDGVQLTTVDAHTLTDGVSIFFAEDVDKIGRFLIHQSKIPDSVLATISDKIANNDRIQKQIEILSKSVDDKIGKDSEKERKMEKDNFTPEIKRLIASLDGLKSEIRQVSLEMRYIPNTQQHQVIWWDTEKMIENAFVPNIDQCSAKEVMELEVSTQMKMLLLLGIGVFSNDTNGKYMEIMKKLVFEERLYLIIANCDFIYGMNYQMCHAFFGKDLKEMTQQKIIQAIGRIGRGQIQQEYTIRIRDDEFFRRLFLPQERNIEAENMCRLFLSEG